MPRLFILLLMTCSVYAGGPTVRMELVASGREKPVLVTHDRVNANRIYIVEQVGRITIVENGKLLEKPFLDIANRIVVDYECGILGLVFHPKFAENGLFYLNYTPARPTPEYWDAPDGNDPNKKLRKPKFFVKTVVSEFKADPKSMEADPNYERMVYSIDQEYINHKGGMVEFGPDGMLYIIMGDGGNQRDPHKNGQNLKTVMGKMLRIDVSPRVGYGIPKDNPFVGRDDARPEIFAYGLRNAWRFSFDRQTGLLYAADVGEDRWEEINIIKSGGNYGWSEREGFYPFNRARPKKDEKPQTDPVTTPATFTDPIKVYYHTEGICITGGNVYRGKAMPELFGWYIYGDYSKGGFWAMKYEDGKLNGDVKLGISNEKEFRPCLPSAFGEDYAGEIYVCSHENGKVWRIAPGR